MASLIRSNIQDFVQEVPVGQMAQGTPFRCLPWPTQFQVVGGRKGEVKPPKCPTRHPGLADMVCMKHMVKRGCFCLGLVM